MHGEPLDHSDLGETLRVRVALPDETRAGRLFRAALRRCAHDADLGPATLQKALVLGSELVNNAVLHGSPPIHAVIAVEGDHLHVDVSDTNPEHPVARPAPPDAPGGRGLNLLAQLATGWGVRDTPTGKTVWCCLPRRP